MLTTPRWPVTVKSSARAYNADYGPAASGPDIQTEILNLPRTSSGRDPIGEKRLRSIAAVPDWGKQRRAWEDVRVETIDSLG